MIDVLMCFIKALLFMAVVSVLAVVFLTVLLLSLPALLARALRVPYGS